MDPSTQPSNQTPQDTQSTQTPRATPTQMAPVQTQLPEQPASTIPPTPGADNPAARQIKNAAGSVFWFGVFLSVVLTLLGVYTLNNDTSSNKAAALGAFAVEIILGIGMIIYGHKLKKLTGDRVRALSTLMIAIALCLGVLIANVGLSLTHKPARLPVPGLIALVAVLYLAVVRAQLKKLP